MAWIEDKMGKLLDSAAFSFLLRFEDCQSFQSKVAAEKAPRN